MESRKAPFNQIDADCLKKLKGVADGLRDLMNAATSPESPRRKLEKYRTLLSDVNGILGPCLTDDLHKILLSECLALDEELAKEERIREGYISAEKDQAVVEGKNSGEGSTSSEKDKEFAELLAKHFKDSVATPMESPLSFHYDDAEHMERFKRNTYQIRELLNGGSSPGSPREKLAYYRDLLEKVNDICAQTLQDHLGMYYQGCLNDAKKFGRMSKSKEDSVTQYFKAQVADYFKDKKKISQGMNKTPVQLARYIFAKLEGKEESVAEAEALEYTVTNMEQSLEADQKGTEQAAAVSEAEAEQAAADAEQKAAEDEEAASIAKKKGKGKLLPCCFRGI